jgi:hypothetical protein
MVRDTLRVGGDSHITFRKRHNVTVKNGVCLQAMSESPL